MTILKNLYSNIDFGDVTQPIKQNNYDQKIANAGVQLPNVVTGEMKIVKPAQVKTGEVGNLTPAQIIPLSQQQSSQRAQTNRDTSADSAIYNPDPNAKFYRWQGETGIWGDAEMKNDPLKNEADFKSRGGIPDWKGNWAQGQPTNVTSVEKLTPEQLLNSSYYSDLDTAGDNYLNTYDLGFRRDTHEKSRADVIRDFQDSIDAIESAKREARDLIIRDYQNILNNRQGVNTAIQARRGLLGSTFGEARRSDIEQTTQQQKMDEITKSNLSYLDKTLSVQKDLREAVNTERDARIDAARQGASAKIEEIKNRQARADEAVGRIIQNAFDTGVDLTQPYYKDLVKQIAQELKFSEKEVLAKYNQIRQAKEAEMAKMAKENALVLDEGQTWLDPATRQVLGRGQDRVQVLNPGEVMANARTGVQMAQGLPRTELVAPGYNFVDEFGRVISQGQPRLERLGVGDVLYDDRGNVIGRGLEPVYPIGEGSDLYSHSGNLVAEGRFKAKAESMGLDSELALAFAQDVVNGKINLKDVPKEYQAAVANAQSMGAVMKQPDPEDIKKAGSMLTAINELQAMDWGQAVGFLTGKKPPLNGQQQAIVDKIDQIKNMATMGNLGLMKGVLSDTDIKVLTSAATSLNRSADKSIFDKELHNLKFAAYSLVNSSKLTPGAPAINNGDGTYSYKNRDGTMYTGRIGDNYQDTTQPKNTNPLGLSGFKKVGSDTNSAIMRKLSTKQNGDKGGQCGRFVNQLTGLGLGNSYESKMAKMDKSIKYPEPGMVFVMPYSWTGHTGFVVGVEGKNVIVKDSNYKLNEKVMTHKIPMSKITGYRRV